MIVIGLILVALIGVCIFVVARWVIQKVFAQVGWAVPDAVAGALSLLIAILFVLWAVKPATSGVWF